MAFKIFIYQQYYSMTKNFKRYNKQDLKLQIKNGTMDQS